MNTMAYITERIGDAVSQNLKTRQNGRVTQVMGTVIHAILPNAKLGELCFLRDPTRDSSILAEVIGFISGAAILTPLTEIRGLSVNTEVIPTRRPHSIKVGYGLIGRVLDGLGEPMDVAEKGPLRLSEVYPIHAAPPEPLMREKISKPVSLGVRAVDGLITCGEGQRLGIFAAAGVGKSSLLSMLAKSANVDVTVVALIGERGREVREFLDDQIGGQALGRIVAVVATADKPAMQRVRAAEVATAIAEYFRDQGLKVLLLMDSVTRYARALREIGLAAGEAPARRGYPPSVFSAMPTLLERAGLSDKGSITGLYTVLMEGDDRNEPISDEMRSILDGHIMLSSDLAAANHFPAIDILGSLSRLMNSLATEQHKIAANKLRSIVAKYKEIEFLIRMGEYKAGTDALADEAIAKIDSINRFLKQDINDRFSLEQTIDMLEQVIK